MEQDVGAMIMHLEQLAAENALLKASMGCPDECAFCPVGGLRKRYGFMGSNR